MIDRVPRVVAALVVASLGIVSGCGSDSGSTAREPGSTASSDPWADIDTTMPSEDPVGTVYGYVEAMAAGEDERGWVVTLPGEPDARWRIREDDAGIWHIA